MPSVVTIDGPAGAGKSTVSRLLAERLGWRLLDTGAMYRAVALAALREGTNLESDEALSALVVRLDVRLPPGRVLLNGEDVSGLIRSVEVTRASQYPASSPSVRKRLVEWQRAFGAEFDVVAEGRDQGTVVFPDAPRKFYLTATAEERARRRHAEFAARRETVALDDVLRQLRDRDARDAARAIAPMRPAADALVIDTTGMDLAHVVELVEQAVRDPGPPSWKARTLDGPTDGALYIPNYFSGLWLAWNQPKTRIVAIGQKLDAALHGAEVAGEPSPALQKAPEGHPPIEAKP